jgi:hypothetical protein
VLANLKKIINFLAKLTQAQNEHQTSRFSGFWHTILTKKNALNHRFPFWCEADKADKYKTHSIVICASKSLTHFLLSRQSWQVNARNNQPRPPARICIYENRWQSRKFADWHRKCEHETGIKRHQVRNSPHSFHIRCSSIWAEKVAAGFPLAVDFIKAAMARYILQLALSAVCVRVQVVRCVRAKSEIGSAHKRQSKTGIGRMTYCGWLALNLAPMRSAVNAVGRRYRETHARKPARSRF